MSDIITIRSRSIAVSHETHWKLTKVAKAWGAATSILERPETSDAIAERFLRDRLDADYPELAVIYRERKSTDQKAVDYISQRSTTGERT